MSATVGKRLLFVGLLTLDVAQLTEALPEAGDKQTAEMAYMDVGGPAANAAVTAAQLDGAAVALHTVVGSGDLADYARRELVRHRVEVIDHAPDAAIPLASIWISAGGERTILATNNAHLVLQPKGGLLPAEAVAVLLDGHYPDLAKAVAREAVDAGIPVVLDCGRWRPIHDELLPLATDIIMCEGFAPPGIDAGSDEERVSAIAEAWNPSLCAMTRGPRDVVYALGGEVYRIAVPRVEVVDTTGAGDVFHGAYMHYHFVAGLSSRDALTAAASAASTSCSHLGVRGAATG
ncbi:MAG: PfkB family carbohydrate kinase [Acidimicrobiia bacterium]|nr:PfkB family carbohydrate kinase [Acidimicrobiia bacterium]